MQGGLAGRLGGFYRVGQNPCPRGRGPLRKKKNCFKSCWCAECGNGARAGKRVIVELTMFLLKDSIFPPRISLEDCCFRALWQTPARWKNLSEKPTRLDSGTASQTYGRPPLRQVPGSRG